MHTLKKDARFIVATTIGNAMEWYDFIAFGFLLAIIAHHFFPSGNATTPYLMAAATFGVSFVARPLGGIVLGIYADRAGRKPALILVLGMMTVATAIVGLSPDYASIGVAASILLVLARILQGISAGGEFGSATAMLFEHAPPGRAGLYGSFQMFTQAVAGFLASVAGFAVTRYLSAGQLDAWGWRLPILAGLVIGPVGWYLRHGLEEPAAFKAVQERASRAPLGAMLQQYWKQLLIAGGLVGGVTVLQFTLAVFMPAYGVRYLKLAPSLPFLAIIIAGPIRMIMCLVFGALSDRLGRTTVMSAGYLSILICTYPLFAWVVHAPSFARLLSAEIVFSVLAAACLGPISTALAEVFPTAIRATAMSITYNVASTIFGGFTPFMLTWLIQSMNDLLAPAYYVIFGALLGLAASLLLARSTFGAVVARSGSPS
jgi:MFS family permease